LQQTSLGAATVFWRQRQPDPVGEARRRGISLLPGTVFGAMTESFGKRLRRLRDERGFSVADLASAVGVSESAIRQLEVGTVKLPSFALGLRLADRLNVDPYYLAAGAGFSMTEQIDRIERRIAKLEQRVASLPAARR
jgi:transcriptional regulator with XRE-family HTH domain